MVRTAHVIKALFILLILIQAVAVAQSVNGVVYDKNTGENLPGANVLLEDLNVGTTTNSEGEFQFSAVAKGEHLLRVSFMGYRIYKIAVIAAEQKDLKIALTPASLSGQEVTVTADRAAERETPAAFSNMQRQHIEDNLWAQELPMLLAELPNLFAYSDAGNGLGYSYLKIRGFD